MKALFHHHRPNAPALHFRDLHPPGILSLASEAEPMALAEKTKWAAAAAVAAKESKLWGGRFQENVTDAVERFGESVSVDKKLYKHDIRGSRAHANMLAQQVALVRLALKNEELIVPGYTHLQRSTIFTVGSAAADVLDACFGGKGAFG